MDVLAAVLALPLLLLPCVLIAFVVWAEDRGPCFFRQERVGLQERVFRVWKFRTMRVDADAYLDERGRPTTDRVTRVGSVLRRTSVDELPQMLNILLGDMSLIGPRPALPSQMRRFNPEQRIRFRVRPGITGWAQINGRNRLRWSERLALDVWYARNVSLAVDLRILLATVRVVALREGVALDRNPDDVDDLPGMANDV